MDKSELKCGFCKHGVDAEKICGKLWYDKTTKCTAHHRCMQYSACLSQYKMKKFGGFKVKKVQKEQIRGSKLRCAICGKGAGKKTKSTGLTGASCGCAIPRCKKTFHFYCARTDKEARTKRIELSKKKSSGGSNEPEVLYRIFCSQEHEDQFRKKEKNDIRYADDTDSDEYNSNYSESDDEDKSDDDDNENDNSSVGSSTSTSKKKQPKNSAKENRQSGNRDDSKLREDDKSDEKSDSDTPSENGKQKSNKEANGSDADSFSESENKKSKKDEIDKKNNVEAKRKLSMPEEADTKKQKLEDDECNKDCSNGSGETVYVVCFLEESTAPEKKTTDILQKCAKKLFDISSENVFLWQYNGRALTSGHMIYLLNDISKTLFRQKATELRRLIFNIEDHDIEGYDSTIEHNDSLDDDVRKNLYENLRKQIAEKFRDANTNYKKCVGKFCLVKALSTYVGFVLLCDSTDSTGEARYQMSGKEITGEKSIYNWKSDVVLPKKNDPNKSLKDVQKEFVKLAAWLEKTVSCTEVHLWPKDRILCAKNEFSVADRVKDLAHKLPRSKSGSHFVVFNPVDSALLQYVPYVRKRIAAILDELLTKKHDVYCVLDVGADFGITNLDDIVGLPLKGIELEAYVAQDPARESVTCAVLHFVI